MKTLEIKSREIVEMKGAKKKNRMLKNTRVSLQSDGAVTGWSPRITRILLLFLSVKRINQIGAAGHFVGKII